MKPDETPAPPEGYRLLTDREKTENALPNDALLLEADGQWQPSMNRGRRTFSPDFQYATRTPVQSGEAMAKPKVICHAPGDRCQACPHYYGKADVCRYAPSAGEVLTEVPTPRTDKFCHESYMKVPGNPDLSDVFDHAERIQEHADQLERETIALREQLVEAQSQLANEQHYSGLLKTAHEKSLESDSPVGACHCLTKSPDILYHKPGCKYRLITERNEARQQLAAEQAKVAEISGNYGQLNDWCDKLVQERNSLKAQRDAAIARAEKAEKRVREIGTDCVSLRSALSTLRKAVEEIARMEPHQHSTTCMEMHRIANAALNAEGGR